MRTSTWNHRRATITRAWRWMTLPLTGGFLKPGDTILEVGGVDLRGKVIGMAEWANMVHFIKHVTRPLAMVVLKCGLFTRERAGLADTDEQTSRSRGGRQTR